MRLSSTQFGLSSTRRLDEEDSAINCKSEWKDPEALGELPIRLYVFRTTQRAEGPEHAIEVAALPLVASSLSGWPIGHSNVFGGSMLGSGRRHGARDGVDKSQIISLTRAVTSRSMNGFVMPLSGSVRRFTLVLSRGDVTVSRRTPALYALGKADPVLLGRRIRQAKRRGEFDSFCSSHRAHSRKPTI